MARTDYDTTLADLPRERTQLLPALRAIHAADAYLSAEGLRAVSRHLFVPESTVYGIATSYNELRLEQPNGRVIGVCTCLSCRQHGAHELLAAAHSLADEVGGCTVVEHECLFICDAGPVAEVDGRCITGATPEKLRAALASPEPPSHPVRPLRDPQPPEVRRVLRRCGTVDPLSLESARAAGGYQVLARAQVLGPEAVITLIEAAGLRGRGGAYFPLAIKLQTARRYAGPRYYVVNAEEGEPGVSKDRYLMEYDPHLLVEGMQIAALALEAVRIYLYINGQADLAAERMGIALAQAQSSGLLPVPVEVRRGAGGYVCGEESVILNSIEGHRAEPRLKPPLPVEQGLWGQPTVISNVETLCNVPLIVQEGREWYRSIGTDDFPGTKVISLGGAVRRPGTYEVPFGTTIRTIVEDLGGGAREGRQLQAVLCGGPSGGLIPADRLDIPIAGGPLADTHAMLGAGGMVVIDDRLPIIAAVEYLSAYNARESCGKCTPCREGMAHMTRLIGEVRHGKADALALAQLDALPEVITGASLCGLGQAAPMPYLSLRRSFPDELPRR